MSKTSYPSNYKIIHYNLKLTTYFYELVMNKSSIYKKFIKNNIDLKKEKKKHHKGDNHILKKGMGNIYSSIEIRGDHSSHICF